LRIGEVAARAQAFFGPPLIDEHWDQSISGREAQLGPVMQSGAPWTDVCLEIDPSAFIGRSDMLRAILREPEVGKVARDEQCAVGIANGMHLRGRDVERRQ
ncbi:MAG TPA: hypothetical protein VFD67_05740, partial [Gemmatimonadaceae bacterium]|nr:hypothetical protein [Gemmatimonadaceae bacterium]